MDSNDRRIVERLQGLPPLEVEEVVPRPAAHGDEGATRTVLIRCLLEGFLMLLGARMLGVIPILILAFGGVVTFYFCQGRYRVLAATGLALCVPLLIWGLPFLVSLGSRVDESEGAVRRCLQIGTTAGLLFLTVAVTATYSRLLLRTPRVPATVRRERAAWYRGAALFVPSLIHFAQQYRLARQAPPDSLEQRRYQMRCKELRSVALYPGSLVMLTCVLWLPGGVWSQWSAGPRRAADDIVIIALLYLALATGMNLFNGPRAGRARVWKRAITSFLTGENGALHSLYLRLLIPGIAVTSQSYRMPFFDWRLGTGSAEVALLHAQNALAQCFGGQPWPTYGELLTLALGFFFPLIVLRGVFDVAAFPFLALTEDALDGAEAVLTPWEGCVQQMQNSANAVERQHFFLGTHATEGYPIVLDTAILGEHTSIVGQSGAGKSSLGLINLAIQMIRQRNFIEVVFRQGRRERYELRDDDPHAAVVVLDLKGDPSLRETLSIEAERSGRTFKYFTNEIDRATYAYNPFLSFTASNVSLNQMVETLLEALGASHGEGYGRSYYSRVARQYLARKLREFQAQYGRSVRSFAELYQFMERTDLGRAEAKETQDAFEIRAAIESLAAFPQLNISDQTSEYAVAYHNAINMTEALKNREVIYFCLPSSKESATCREIAKLALYDLLLCAQAADGQYPAYVMIDEFQRIAGENFKVVLQQARSMGISLCLACQTTADLNMPDCDLRPTIETNTRLKLIFTASDKETLEWAIQSSGETREKTVTTSKMERFSDGWSSGRTTGQSGMEASSSSTRGSSGGKSWGTTETETEMIVPRLQLNDIIRISDDPSQCIVHVTRGSGYTQFGGFAIPVRMSHAVSRDEYNARRNASWPARQDGVTLIAREMLAQTTSLPTGASAPQETADSPEIITADAGVQPSATDFQEMLRIAQETIQKRQNTRPMQRKKKST